MNQNNAADELSRLWDAFISWLPLLFSAVIAFVVGWIISVILRSLVVRILRGIGLNRRIRESESEGIVYRLTDDPSGSIGSFVYWLLMTITILVAVSYLQIPVINEFIQRFYNYIPAIIGAIFILLVALAVSGSLSVLITRWMGESITGKVLATSIPVVILSIAGFAILEQLGVAPIILSTTYIAVMGSVSLAAAIAFGLGGRGVAAKILESGYEKGLQSMDRIRSDISKGSQRAKQDVEKAKRSSGK